MNTTNSTFPTPTNGTEHSPETVKAFSKSLGILLVPISVVGLFCVLGGLVYYFLKKRKLDQLRHHLVPMYSFDPTEGDEWEAEVPEPTILDPKQIRKPDYQTMGGGIGSGSNDIASPKI